jgi:carbon storage regulator
MLSLTRKPGEDIMIGENIRIVFARLDTSAMTIRLKIEAPRDIPVFRGELFRALQTQNGVTPQAPHNPSRHDLLRNVLAEADRLRNLVMEGDRGDENPLTDPLEQARQYLKERE